MLKRRYLKEFKEKLVKLSIGSSTRESIEKPIGISKGTLRIWKENCNKLRIWHLYKINEIRKANGWNKGCDN